MVLKNIPALQQLKYIATLKDDWDGEGTPAEWTKTTFINVRKLIKKSVAKINIFPVYSGNALHLESIVVNNFKFEIDVKNNDYCFYGCKYNEGEPVQVKSILCFNIHSTKPSQVIKLFNYFCIAAEKGELKEDFYGID